MDVRGRGAGFPQGHTRPATEERPGEQCRVPPPITPAEVILSLSATSQPPQMCTCARLRQMTASHAPPQWLACKLMSQRNASLVRSKYLGQFVTQRYSADK